jgi:hypothetical protein
MFLVCGECDAMSHPAGHVRKTLHCLRSRPSLVPGVKFAPAPHD